jgi:hypothetical protein
MRIHPLLACLLLPACASVDDPSISEETGEIEIEVDPPEDVNCLAVHLVDQDDEPFDFRQPIEDTIRLPAVGVGAYQAMATAYAAADCADEPDPVPWATLQPVSVIVTRATATVTLRLYRVGSVTVGTDFVVTSEVVAQNQPRIGMLAARGNTIAWTHRPGNDTIGSVHVLVDNDPGNAPVAAVAMNQQRPQDLAFDPPTGALFWASGQTAAEPPVSNGAIYGWNGTVVTALATAQSPGEIAVGGGRVWWNAMDADEIRSAPVAGGAGTAIAAPGNNAITTDATHVYWTSWSDHSIRRAPLAGGPVQDIVPAGAAPTPPIGLAVDDLYVYWTDWDEADNTSVILRAPIAGGAIVQIFPPPGEPRIAGTWPVEVDAGWVYFAGGGAVYRVPRDGGMAELIQDGAISGFALTHWADHAWLYWGDRDLGGLVWRQRLD